VTVRELRRLLCRVELGRESSETLARSLREELRLAGDREAIVRRDPSSIRAWNGSQLLVEIDTAFGAARHTVDQKQYRDCVQHVAEVQALLSRLQLLLGADAEISKARSDAGALAELVHTARLRELTTVSGLERLLELARKMMVDGEYRQARCVAGLCRGGVAPLLLRGTGPERGPALERALAAIADLCAKTAEYSDERDDLPEDGTLTALSDMLRDGYFELVERLTADLQIVLRHRRRFQVEISRAPAAEPATEIVTPGVRCATWTLALEELWRRRVAMHTAELERQLERLAQLEQSVAAWAARGEIATQKGVP